SSEEPTMAPSQDIYTPEFTNEPPVDFAKAENRAAMRAALESVRAQFGQHYPLVINNAEVTTVELDASGNPSEFTETIGVASRAERRHLARGVDAAKAASPAWAARPVAERADYLYKAADVMRQRRFELAAWIVLECGKPWAEATGDVDEAIDFCEY